MYVTGKNVDDQLIIGNIFENMSSRLGVPLEFMLEILKKNNMVVDWVKFYEDSKKMGWSYKTTRFRVDSSVGDIYGSVYRDEVLKRLDWYHEHIDRCPSG